MMLAARNIFLAARRKPTAKSYVQDGLIAMWDGIENAGWGVHDASATTVKDLTGGPWGDWNIQGVGADYFSFSNAAQLKTLASFTVPGTIELSFFDWVGTGGAFLNFGDKTNWSSMGSSGCLCPYRPNGSVNNYEYYSKQTSVLLSSASIPISTFTVKFSTAGVGVYVSSAGYTWKSVSNTMSYTALSIGRYASKPFTGKIRFVRFYSRALTADEIAAHHAIDKARFNLP